jgi:hypothetical protein
MAIDYDAVAHPGASYWLKVQRAEQHFAQLKELLAPNQKVRPYDVRESFDGKTNEYVYRAFAAEQPDPWLAIVAGDFFNNIRSALDHVRAALVPTGRRRDGYFPIFDEDFRERCACCGEQLERNRKTEDRWNAYSQGMPKEAIAFILDRQPFMVGDDPEARADRHALKILNALTNADKHKSLVVLASGIQIKSVEVTDLRRPSRSLRTGRGHRTGTGRSRGLSFPNESGRARKGRRRDSDRDRVG